MQLGADPLIFTATAFTKAFLLTLVPSTRPASFSLARLIISANKLFEGKGWTHIKTLECDMQRLRPARIAINFVFALIRHIPSLTQLNRLDIIDHVQFMEKKTGERQIFAGKLDTLMQRLAPQLEEFTLVGTAWELEWRSFFAALSPSRVRILRIAPLGSVHLFAHHPWLALEELWVKDTSLKSEKGKLAGTRFGNLKRLYLIGCKDPYLLPLRTAQRIQMLVEKNPYLHLVSFLVESDLDTMSSFECSPCSSSNELHSTWDALSEAERLRLAAIVRLHHAPLWMLVCDTLWCDSQFYNGFYTKNPRLELRDLLCSANVCLARNIIYPTRMQALWLEDKVRGVFGDQMHTIPPPGLEKGLASLCILLLDSDLDGPEAFWRSKLTELVVPTNAKAVNEALCMLLNERTNRTRRWLQNLLTSEPLSPLSLGVVKAVPEFCMNSPIHTVDRLEVLVASHPNVVESSDWFFKCIRYMLLDHAPTERIFLEMLQFAHGKGWHGTVGYLSFDPHLSQSIRSDSASILEMEKILFRVLEDAHNLIKSNVVALCYEQWGNFARIADWVREHHDVFCNISPDTVKEMQECFADSIWGFVLRSRVVNDVERAVQAASVVVKPSGRFHNLLNLEGERLNNFCKHLNCKPDRAIAVQAVVKATVVVQHG